MLIVRLQLEDYVVGLEVLGTVIEHRQQSKVELMSVIDQSTIEEVLILPLVKESSNVGIELQLATLPLQAKLHRCVLKFPVGLQPRVHNTTCPIFFLDLISIINLHTVESPGGLEQLIPRNPMPQLEAISQKALTRSYFDQLIERKCGLFVLGLEMEAQWLVVAEVFGEFLVVEVGELLVLVKHQILIQMDWIWGNGKGVGNGEGDCGNARELLWKFFIVWSGLQQQKLSGKQCWIDTQKVSPFYTVLQSYRPPQ